MNFKLFKKSDRRILIVALLLFFLSTLLLWQDGWLIRFGERTVTLDKIGDVTDSKNDVRRRFVVALSWLPLKKYAEVYQGDSVFTGPNSSVVIKISSGEELIVAPNSFVVISQKKDAVAVNIGFGSIEGQMGKDKKLLISSNNTVTEVKGRDARIKVDAGEGNKLLLNVVAGEVRVRSQDNENILRTTEKALLTPKGINYDEPNIAIVGPLEDQHLKFHFDEPIPFRWKTPHPFTRMKVKISSDVNFKKILVDSRVDENNYTAYNLPRDVKLYWQVMGEGGISRIQSFTMIGDHPPTPTSPRPGHEFFYDPAVPVNLAGSQISLEWEPGSSRDQFEVELATSRDLKRDLRKFTSLKSHLDVGFLPKGNYFWRVRSTEFPNERWSSISSFKVDPEPSKMLSAPVPVITAENFLIPTKIHGLTAAEFSKFSTEKWQNYIEALPELHWSTVAHAKRYGFQISANKDFQKLMGSQNSSQSFYRLKLIEPGQFYWRVKSENATADAGLYTSTQTLNVGVAPPQSLTKPLIIDEVPDRELLDATPPALKISWNPTVFTKFYEVEFGSSSDYKSATTFITANNDRQIQIERPGVYFWRVRSLDNQRNPISPYSPSYTLEFKRIYRDPALSKNLLAIYPQQQDSIIMVGRDQSEIEFRWSNAYREKKAHYRIELSYEPNFETVFFSDSTEYNFYKYKTPFMASVVYWRVRAEASNFTSEWTGANRFLVSYERDGFGLAKSDQMFEARQRAQERQNTLLAEYRSRVAFMRSPAASRLIQLDAPQFAPKLNEFKIESNLNRNLTPLQMAAQPFANFYEQVRNYPTLRWDKVPSAERYIVEIARDPQFQNLIVKTPTTESFYTWESVRPGDFYYRVQAFNEKYTQSPRTPTEHLKVLVESPTPTSQDQFVEVFDEPRGFWPPPQPFRLTWTPVVFARGYEVEFSEDAFFSNAKLFKTVANNFEFTVSKNGLYFWRVRALGSTGVEISAYSPIRSVEIIQTQRGPASVNGLAGLFPLNRTMVFVGHGTMNLPFQWLNPKASDRMTQVEISTDPTFKTILAAAASKSQKVLIQKNLPEGKLFWRVRSENEVSSVYEFQLRREYEPYQRAPAQQPKTHLGFFNDSLEEKASVGP